jgi:uroporphyrinogen decarboxylase
VFDYIWPDTLKQWVAEGYPTDANGEPVPVEDHLGFDMAGAGGWIQTLPRYGPGSSETLDESDEWIVTRNGAGAVFKHWKSKSGTPEHIGFHMTSRKVWDRECRPLLLEPDRNRFDVETTRQKLALQKKKRRWSFFGMMFMCELMRATMGDVCMLESMLLDPDWIHDFCRVYTNLYRNCYTVIFKEAGRPDGIWIYEDLGYRNGLFCSPAVVRSLLLPYYAEIVDFFHSHGLPVILHSCGNINEALPLFVEAGFDGLHPMEVKAGCNVITVAEEYGNKLALFGGFDIRILESGDRRLIRKTVAAHVEGLKVRGARFVFGSDHSISTNVALADLLFAHEVYREHMFNE